MKTRGPSSLKSSLSLAEAARRLSAVVDNATVAIFLMNEHQECIFMNRSGEKLTGYSLTEIQGRSLHDVVHHTRPDGRHYPIEECPIDRAFPELFQMQGEEIFVHKDGTFYPVAFTASPIFDEASNTVGTVLEVRDIRKEKLSEAQKDLLLLEVNHRTRNVLAVVLGIVRLTEAENLVAFKDVVEKRIDALARTQRVLSRTSWQGIRLADLVQDEIKAFASLDLVDIQDDDFFLPAGFVQPLCMTLHELTTNAVKYGSLSVAEGRVSIGWDTVGSQIANFWWRERGGPRVARPLRTGFGARLIHQLARQLNAVAHDEWAMEGLSFSLHFAMSETPIERIVDAR